MITPLIIQIVFWVGVILCLSQGFLLIGSSFNASTDTALPAWDSRDSERTAPDTDKQKAKAAPTKSFSLIRFAFGVAVLILGPLMVRLYCELLIIIFKIHDELKESNDRHRYRT